jgi:hypothetical protein
MRGRTARSARYSAWQHSRVSFATLLTRRDCPLANTWPLAIPQPGCQSVSPQTVLAAIVDAVKRISFRRSSQQPQLETIERDKGAHRSEVHARIARPTVVHRCRWRREQMQDSQLLPLCRRIRPRSISSVIIPFCGIEYGAIMLKKDAAPQGVQHYSHRTRRAIASITSSRAYPNRYIRRGLADTTWQKTRNAAHSSQPLTVAQPALRGISKNL